MLITLSGIDGSGKSTIATKLESELTMRGKSVVQMEFPYSKNWLLLEQLKRKGNNFDKYGKDNSYIGYMINFERFAYLLDYVIPNLVCYDYIILQRFFVDFAAIGIAQVTNINEIFLLKDMRDLLKIDMKNYCIDISHELAYERITQRGKSCDLREEKNFHCRLAKAYKTCLNNNYFGDCILDGTEAPNQIVENIIRDVI